MLNTQSTTRWRIWYRDWFGPWPGGHPDLWQYHGSAESEEAAREGVMQLRLHNPGIEVKLCPPLDRQQLAALMADTHGLDEAMAAEMRR